MYQQHIHFQNWFVMSHKVHGYHTRSNINITDGTKINNLFIPSARTTNYGLKQLKVNCPRIWNTSPNNIKNSSILHAFLSEYRLTLFYFIFMFSSSQIFFFFLLLLIKCKKKLSRSIIILLLLVVVVVVVFYYYCYY